MDGENSEQQFNPEVLNNPEVPTPEKPVLEHQETEKVFPISKKSRIFVQLAFDYALNSEALNAEFGTKNLNDYLQYATRRVEAGDAQLEQAGLGTVEECLQEMSDQEIKDTVEFWKESDRDNEEKYNEYLKYILEKDGPKNEPVPEAGPSASLLPEFAKAELNIAPENIKIDDSKLPNKLELIISIEGKEDRKIAINLPNAARVGNKADVEKFKEAVIEVVSKAKGNLFPRFEVTGDKLAVGIGLGAKRDGWAVVEEFSTEDLVKITGCTIAEAEEFLFLRARDWKKLTTEQQTTRDSFEKKLKKSEVEGYSPRHKVTFFQKVRDLAVAQRWAEIIGEKRYDELLELSKNQPLKERPISRWEISQKTLENPEFKAKQDSFLKLLKSKFLSWTEALSDRGNLIKLVDGSGLTVPETLYVFGKQIFQEGRADLWPEFEHMFRMSFVDLKKHLKSLSLADSDIEKIMGDNRPKTLRALLLYFVQTRPLESDQWHKIGAATGEKASVVSAVPISEVLESNDFREDRNIFWKEQRDGEISSSPKRPLPELTNEEVQKIIDDALKNF